MVNVRFHPDVSNQLQSLPRPAGVKQLAGSRGDWRVRIGEYRIIYAIDDRAKTGTGMRVAHRRDSYR
ncbi:MAG: type II toxin-antitoxin system RelE family toxin [Natronosporangium sp.]